MRDSRAGILIRIVLIGTLMFASLGLTGCDAWFLFGDGDIWDRLHMLLEEFLEEGELDLETEDVGNVQISLTHPAGASPNVFTTGWVFGASATMVDEDGTHDLSSQVEWSGTGSFSPNKGIMSRPSFNAPGGNQITLAVVIDGDRIEKTFSVSAVDPGGYACVGDNAVAPSDGHGCVACPHPGKGPIITGSPNVFIGGKPAARVGDRGVHAACCGPNTFEITSGDSSVMINGRPAAKIGSTTQHCGGPGTITND